MAINFSGEFPHQSIGHLTVMHTKNEDQFRSSSIPTGYHMFTCLLLTTGYGACTCVFLLPVGITHESQLLTRFQHDDAIIASKHAE